MRDCLISDAENSQYSTPSATPGIVAQGPNHPHGQVRGLQVEPFLLIRDRERVYASGKAINTSISEPVGHRQKSAPGLQVAPKQGCAISDLGVIPRQSGTLAQGQCPEVIAQLFSGGRPEAIVQRISVGFVSVGCPDQRDDNRSTGEDRIRKAYRRKEAGAKGLHMRAISSCLTGSFLRHRWAVATALG